jgi:hypothetical protein
MLKPSNMKLAVSNIEALRIVNEKVEHVNVFVSRRLSFLSNCNKLVHTILPAASLESNPFRVIHFNCREESQVPKLASSKELGPDIYLHVQYDSVKHGNS